jgi:hypothetical protein
LSRPLNGSSTILENKPSDDVVSSRLSKLGGLWSILTNSSVNPVNLFADLEEFVHDHRPHGPLTADASAPAWNGYQLTVACPCGVVFQRWVTPEDAELDLLHFASLT